MTTDELVQYYVDLLIMQYALQPNARATVGAFVRQSVADQIISEVRDGFNLPYTVGALSDTAIGKQLEAVASYRGLTRLVFGVDITRQYFRMPEYGETDADTAPGMPDYGDPVTWYFITYQDANRPIYEMNDSELTRLTQFRARASRQLESIKEVDDLLYAFFGDNAAVFESGTMTMTYLFLENDPDSLSFLVEETESLPRPAGVRLQVIRADSISGLFGFQNYSQTLNNTFVGYGLYGAPQAAAFLRY